MKRSDAPDPGAFLASRKRKKKRVAGLDASSSSSSSSSTSSSSSSSSSSALQAPNTPLQHGGDSPAPPLPSSSPSSLRISTPSRSVSGGADEQPPPLSSVASRGGGNGEAPAGEGGHRTSISHSAAARQFSSSANNNNNSGAMLRRRRRPLNGFDASPAGSVSRPPSFSLSSSSQPSSQQPSQPDGLPGSVRGSTSSLAAPPAPHQRSATAGWRSSSQTGLSQGEDWPNPFAYSGGGATPSQTPPTRPRHHPKFSSQHSTASTETGGSQAVLIAPERDFDLCGPVLDDLPKGTAAGLTNVGRRYVGDFELITKVERALAISEREFSKNNAGAGGHLHRVGADRLQLMAALARSAQPSPTHQTILVIPHDAALSVRGKRLEGPTLLHREAITDHREDAFEVWPLRRNKQFLASQQDDYALWVDQLLLLRAGSEWVPVRSKVDVPRIDISFLEGYPMERRGAAERYLLPLWCAEVLTTHQVVEVELPPYFEAVELKQMLSMEELNKEELTALPIRHFFEVAQQLVFNPRLWVYEAIHDLEKERGLLIQLWDRRQAKIANVLGRKSPEEGFITFRNMQPSETCVLSSVECRPP